MTNSTDLTMWTEENLLLRRGLNSASVDLIYLDLPTNSNLLKFEVSLNSRSTPCHQTGPRYTKSEPRTASYNVCQSWCLTPFSWPFPVR